MKPSQGVRDNSMVMICKRRPLPFHRCRFSCRFRIPFRIRCERFGSVVFWTGIVRVGVYVSTSGCCQNPPVSTMRQQLPIRQTVCARVSSGSDAPESSSRTSSTVAFMQSWPRVSLVSPTYSDKAARLFQCKSGPVPTDGVVDCAAASRNQQTWIPACWCYIGTMTQTYL